MGNYIMFIWIRHSCAKFLISIWQITPWLRLRSQFSEKFPFPHASAPGNIRTAAVCIWRRRRGYICLMKSRRSHRFVWEARWLALWFTCALTQRECVCVGVRERRRELEESGRSQRRQWQCLCCCAPFRGRLALSFFFSFADVFKLKRDKQTIKINLRA